METKMSSTTQLRQYVEEYYKMSNISEMDDFEASQIEDETWITPKSIQEALDGLHPDVVKKFIGCGLNTPECWEGLEILELGCGCGRDSFFMSKMIGPNGHVTGIDMSEERVKYCKNKIDYHMQKYGYSQSNVDFKACLVEEVKSNGIASNSIDLVTANCCIVLCPDPSIIFKAVYDSLKEGGEMYFVEMYSQSPPPPEFRNDKVLYCEGFCAQYWGDFLDTTAEIGFSHPRLVRIATLILTNELKEKIGTHQVVTVTYRMFKLPKKAHAPVRVTYKGGILDHEDQLRFDHATYFKVNQPINVDAELGATLKYSRFSKYFSFETLPYNAKIDTKHPRLDPFEIERQQMKNHKK